MSSNWDEIKWRFWVWLKASSLFVVLYVAAIITTTALCALIGHVVGRILKWG